MITLLLTLVTASVGMGGTPNPTAVASPQAQTDLVGPPGSGNFGTSVTVLENGNLVITDPKYSSGGMDWIGAVYLYDGETGERISMLTGSSAYDMISYGGVFSLTNGNFVIFSPVWDYNAAEAGAVTWCSGTTGCSGTVSPANSLVGPGFDWSGERQVVTPLSNGNYVVVCTLCDVGGIIDAGAVTWADGSTGVTGFPSAANSLVGSTAGDYVGASGVTPLPNGNYVVGTETWINGTVSYAGAATWCDGDSGCIGPVTSANSLVGSTEGDRIGRGYALPNGNYYVWSMAWDNGDAVDAGSITWCPGESGCSGVVSATNSLVGGNNGDNIGLGGIWLLANGNFVVISQFWEYYGIAEHAGAATLCSGTTGCAGVVSPANSLVGDWSNDEVGSGFVIPLTNGNYVVLSPRWERYHEAGIENFNQGAATWCDGTSGCTGTVSTANSLVGTNRYDQVGVGGWALPNGSYVVRSPYWDGTVEADVVGDVGAVTWCPGVGGCIGEVSPANSLVGEHMSDSIGSSGVFPLANGNYVVSSPYWDNGTILDAGAATWCDGNAGCTGVISAANSLVGSQRNDTVASGGITALTNGNYVVNSTNWNNGGLAYVGAITWVDGDTGLAGYVTPENSLVGSSSNDWLGFGGVMALFNGNYVVRSPYWDDASVVNAGAVTLADGTAGMVGVVSSANSLVGSTAEDMLGTGSFSALADGRYVISSPKWDNSVNVDAGAVTLGSGSIPLSGPITADNSVIGYLIAGGPYQFFLYNTIYDYLIVSRPEEKIVTIFPALPDSQPPLPPTLLSPADEATIDDQTPTLTWQASSSPDTDGYLLDLDGTVMDVGNTTEYTTPELVNEDYTWRVAAYDVSGNTSEYTDPWTFTVEIYTPGPTLYVNGTGGVDSGDCRNPSAPCCTVGYAHGQAASGNTILVAAGTYPEILTLSKPITLRGGYAQSGATWTPQAGETILDGQLADTVVTLLVSASGTMLDSLTITNGYGVAAGGVDSLNASLTIQNCIIRDNEGYNSEFSIGGGGVVGAAGSNSLTIVNSLIVRNQINQGASGVRAHSGTLTMLNTLVANNSGDWGLHVNGPTDFLHVTIAYNQNGVLFNASGVQHVIKNSILWSNLINAGTGTVTISYSDIQGGYTGNGNVDVNPLFVSTTAQDYHLQPGSQIINAGDPAGALATDLDGKLRDALPDMGAYEWTNLKFLLSFVRKASLP